jgi:hypothetical protein
MSWNLYAARYDDTDWIGVDPAEYFLNPANVGVRWALPDGVQRIELTIKAASRFDAYNRYRNHLGQIIAIFDSKIHRQISGNIYEIIIDGRYVHYICAGPWKRTYDNEYTLTNFSNITPTDYIDDLVNDILLDAVAISNSDQSGVTDPLVQVGAWSPKKHDGDQPIMGGDALIELGRIGHASNQIMDFFFTYPPFDGATLKKPLPNFRRRIYTTPPNAEWFFRQKDLAPDGLFTGRHIWDLKRDIYVKYGRLSGQHDGANNLSSLIDTGTNFFTSGVNIGDEVYNITDLSSGTVLTMATTTNPYDTLTFEGAGLQGGSEDDFDTGDWYSINLKTPVSLAVQSSSETDLWNTVYIEVRPEMDQTQAANYQDQLEDEYEKAQLQQSFVLGSPRIRDTDHQQFPLWYPLFSDRFSFKIMDLYPDYELTSNFDRQQFFYAVALDYTFADNRLRIVPSTSDGRLDSLLAQAGLISGQIVNTQATIRERRKEEQERIRAGWQWIREQREEEERLWREEGIAPPPPPP